MVQRHKWILNYVPNNKYLNLFHDVSQLSPSTEVASFIKSWRVNAYVPVGHGHLFNLYFFWSSKEFCVLTQGSENCKTEAKNRSI